MASSNTRIELKDHQRDHVDRLTSIVSRYHIGLDFSIMGSGKTYTSSTVALRLGVKRVIVICPVSVKSKWAMMKSTFNVPIEGLFSFAEVRGVPTGVKHGLLTRLDIPNAFSVETTYTATPLLREWADEGLMVIVDECHNMKNDSLVSNSCAVIIHAVKSGQKGYVLMMSGSPFDKEEHVMRMYKSMGVWKGDHFVAYDIRSNKSRWVGLGEIVDYAWHLDREETKSVIDILSKMKKAQEKSTTRKTFFMRLKKTLGGIVIKDPTPHRERRIDMLSSLLDDQVLSMAPVETLTGMMEKPPRLDTFDQWMDDLAAKLRAYREGLKVEGEEWYRFIAEKTCVDPGSLRVDVLKPFAYTLFQRVFKKNLASSMPKVEERSIMLDKRNLYLYIRDEESRTILKRSVNALIRTVRFNEETGEIDIPREDRIAALRDITQSLMTIETAKITTFVRYARQKLESMAQRKVVLCFNYIATIHDVAKGLEDYNPLILTGSLSSKQREQVLAKFAEPSVEHRVLIANVAVASVGVDLDDKHGDFPRLMLVNPNFNMMDMFQLGHRVYRSDTKSHSRVEFVYGADHPEGRILNALTRKSRVMRDTVGDQDDAILPDMYRNVVEDREDPSKLHTFEKMREAIQYINRVKNSSV